MLYYSKMNGFRNYLYFGFRCDGLST